jgi:hypothetical protein
VIYVGDSLPVSATPSFASANECYLLEENQAVLSVPVLHHLLKETSPAHKKRIKNLTAKLSQELGFGSFSCPLCYFEMFL